MMLGGLERLSSRTDVPFGIVQLAGVAGGASFLLVKQSLTARWAIVVALAAIVLGCGLAEIAAGDKIWGVAVLALAPVPVLAMRYGQRKGSPNRPTTS